MNNTTRDEARSLAEMAIQSYLYYEAEGDCDSDEAIARAVGYVGDNFKPIIICLCGSTRFYDAFQRANYEETMAGKIVLSVGFYPHSTNQAHGEEIGVTPEQKLELDELHKRKIDLCDEVYVLNVGGYIGTSTRGEIEYAVAMGKPVRYLEGME